jgi:hypothetical protein
MSVAHIQQIVEQFEKIHLEEMDRVQLMDRVDTKFTFSQSKLAELLPILSKDYKILEVDGVLLSEYESLYYDDANLSLYINHHRKRLDRFKVRYRKYVNSNIAFLEVKHKKNGRTEKSRIPADDIPYTMAPEQEKFVRKQGLEGAELVPSLLNGFKRITLVNKTMNERLTLDIDLTFKWKDEEKKISNVIIAELKQERVIRNSPFYALMKKNLIRPLRVSKYCIGIVTMYGTDNVKYNRFKKKLLKIKKIQLDAA